MNMMIMMMMMMTMTIVIMIMFIMIPTPYLMSIKQNEGQSISFLWRGVCENNYKKNCIQVYLNQITSTG